MIKCRVRDLKTKEIVGYEWIENDRWRCRQSHWVDKDDYCFGTLKYIDAIREQFTNLTDKKSVDIYDNDDFWYRGSVYRVVLDDDSRWCLADKIDGVICYELHKLRLRGEVIHDKQEDK